MKLRLREVLKERSLTLKAFSELSGISQPNLSNYINGNISPTLEMLSRISKVLNISVSSLIEEDQEISIYVKFQDNMYQISKDDIINLLIEKYKNHNG